MAHYDAHGRPVRGSEEPSYFGDDSESTYPDYYVRRARGDNPSPRPREMSNARRHYSPHNDERMSSVTDRSDTSRRDDVSPDVIAAITEQVKREVMEHFKQTGTVDDLPKSEPLRQTYSNRSSITSSPPPSTNRKIYTPPSPTYTSKAAGPPPTETYRNDSSIPFDNTSGARFADRPLPTKTIARSFSSADLSTIDQKWSRLFNSDGSPTQRLGQFLRGMANHIIEDFIPKKSIVVTPRKMAEYYGKFQIEKEPHPLLTIFRAQSNELISQLYQDLGCEHHLVQEDNRSPPVVPALTAVGFAHWMTIHVLAYPEEEWQRLESVVLDMPINADGDLIDGKPERLPKQISRYLLPAKEDSKSRNALRNAIEDFLDDLDSTDRRKRSITSTPVDRTPSKPQQSFSHPVEIHQDESSSTSGSNPLERDRKPYSGAPCAAESSTGNDEPPVKIERERQPYTAQPGSGKIYHDEGNFSGQSRPHRANSTATRPKDKSDLRGNYHHRTSSTTSQPYMPGLRPRRPSSPPLKNYSQSTPADIEIGVGSKYGPSPSSSFASGSYGSNMSFPPPPPGPPPRVRDDRQYRRGPDDDVRFVGDMNGPRDAERLDHLHESRGEGDRFVPYERGSVSLDPRDARGAPAEEWYRDDKGRGAEYDDYRRYA